MIDPDALLDLDERLHAYQIRAVSHLWENPRGALFLEMGLGKTATTLCALTPDHLPALVVGPKRVAEHVWPKEVSIWRPDLSVAVAAGTPEQRKRALAAGADITAIGVANLKDVQPGWKTIIFDESSLYKSSQSARWRLASNLARYCRHVWLLTGTPAPNGLVDLWSQIYLIDQGARLGHGKRFNTGIDAFRKRWFEYNEYERKYYPRKGAQNQIQEKIGDICLSMRAEDYLELPSITYNTVEVSLPSKAIRAYTSMQETLIAELDNEETITAVNAAVLTGKLSQITAGFLYHEDKTYTPLHTEKVEAVKEIVDGTGSPVLVFYRFKAEREMLMAAMPDARDVKEDGVLDAWDRGEVPVMLAHPASAGHGLNLAKGGHTIVWTTLSWSAEQWAQANARLHRQGQTKPVMVHLLEHPKSVDRQIYDVLCGKVSLQDAVMKSLDRL